MASTSYLSRIIYKEADDGESDFSGTYKKLLDAKSIPAPSSAPNTVESTTLEDDSQTFEMGIKTNDAKEITGNLSKEDAAAIKEIGTNTLDIIHLYGTDGVGEVAKWAYQAQITYTVNDVGGADEILEMTVTAVPKTASVDITDDYTVTVDTSGETFTVTAAS